MNVESDNIDGWLDDEQPSSSEKKTRKNDVSLFMKLEKRQEPYRVRLASSRFAFRKHWDVFKSLKQYPISPAYEKDEKDLDVAWKEGGFVPRKRAVALVIDRENPGMLRILEAGEQVFKAFKSFATMTKKNPAGNSGPDWLISVGINPDNNQVQYSVMPDPSGSKPFTEEETKMINESKINIKSVEERWFKKATPEEVRALWEQLPVEKRYAPKKKADDDEDDDDKKNQKSQPSDPKDQESSTPAAKDDFLKDKPAENQQDLLDDGDEDSVSLF